MCFVCKHVRKSVKFVSHVVNCKYQTFGELPKEQPSYGEDIHLKGTVISEEEQVLTYIIVFSCNVMIKNILKISYVFILIYFSKV